MAYATLTQLRSYLNFSAGVVADDSLLTDLLSRAQAIVDLLTQRHFEAATETRYYDAIADVDDQDLWLHRDDDLLAVTTLTNGNGTVILLASYALVPANTTPKFGIRLKASSGLAWTYTTDPENAISVAGAWGYSTTAPGDIANATIELAAFLYRRRDAQTFDVTATPDGGQLVVPSGIPKSVWTVIMANKRVI